MFYDNNEYFSQYSAPLISFRNRRASQSEFDQYWAKKEPVKEELTASIKRELARMPSVAKPAGLDYYLQLHYKLFDSFCKDVAKAMVTKSHDPASTEIISEV